jgi:hypothetical protein
MLEISEIDPGSNTMWMVSGDVKRSLCAILRLADSLGMTANVKDAILGEI